MTDKLNIGPISIKYYSICILLAIIVACTLIYKEAKKKNIDEDNFINLVFYTILIGILGARLYYVLFNLDYYLSNPIEILAVWHGGLAIHGGLLVGLLVIIYYTRKHNINTLCLLDIVVVGVIIAQSIGRWGNFFNKEAYGGVISLYKLKSLHIPSFIINNMYIDGSYHEPTFLYESVLSIIGFIILLVLRNKLHTGQVTSIYLIWYGIERFFIESLRTDSLMLGSIKVAQLVSILFIISGIILFIKNRNNTKYSETNLIKEVQHV